MTQQDTSALAICAVRYALGRTTYAAAEVAGIVSRLDLSERDRAIIMRDIDQADRSGNLGDECDARAWRACLLALSDRVYAEAGERGR